MLVGDLDRDGSDKDILAMRRLPRIFLIALKQTLMTIKINVHIQYS